MTQTKYPKKKTNTQVEKVRPMYYTQKRIANFGYSSLPQQQDYNINANRNK